MRRFWMLWVAGACLLSACSRMDGLTPEDGVVTPNEVLSVVFEAPTIENGDPATKISLVENEGSPGFLWESTDTVGIFPGSGSQVYFSMSEGAGTKQAIFDGGAWALRGSSAYYSYYPFVGNMYLEAGKIPVDFTGQCQVGMPAFQDARIYLSSEGTTAGNGSLRFSYVMVNTLVRVNATLPAGTYTNASMTLAEPLFVKDGTYSLSSPDIVAEHHTRRIDVKLDNFVLQESATVPIYFSLAPVDLQGKTITVEVESAGGRRYRCTKTPSRTYAAGKWYELHCTMTCIDPPMAVQSREPLWTELNMPNRQDHQFAATAEEAAAPGFDPSQHRIPYIQWYEAPAAPNGTCALLITGDDYNACPDAGLMDRWSRELTSRGVQCAALVYRTPRPIGLHYCLSAWQDAQRAVRMIRSGALNRGINPDAIGVVSLSAGSHAAMMLAASSTAPSYTAVDAIDNNACNLNWAIVHAPVYCTTDNDGSELAGRDGYGTDITLNPLLLFDEKTCPISLHHGQDDPYTPMASTLIYRKLRTKGIPAEVHLYPGRGHGAHGFERGLEFLTQLQFLGPLQAEQDIMQRYSSDADLDVPSYKAEFVWPAGRVPDYQSHQSDAVIEWWFPKVRKTKAIQILFSGGAYNGSASNSSEVAPVRRYLNAKGVTVVTLLYRYPRPQLLAKHTSAWEDLQRAIRMVRSEAEGYGLDPNRIGIMGSSAGGHLAVMGATSSRHQAYHPIDDIDRLSCKVQWGIGIYPAYLLTDDWEFYGYQYNGSTIPQYVGNAFGGNTDDAVLAPEFSFDLDTAPMLLIHGDADPYASMNSVKLWEKLRRMGIPAEVHTLAMRQHGFQWYASPGTGSYNYMDRIAEYLEPWMED